MRRSTVQVPEILLPGGQVSGDACARSSCGFMRIQCDGEFLVYRRAGKKARAIFPLSGGTKGPGVLEALAGCTMALHAGFAPRTEDARRV